MSAHERSGKPATSGGLGWGVLSGRLDIPSLPPALCQSHISTYQSISSVPPVQHIGCVCPGPTRQAPGSRTPPRLSPAVASHHRLHSLVGCVTHLNALSESLGHEDGSALADAVLRPREHDSVGPGDRQRVQAEPKLLLGNSLHRKELRQHDGNPSLAYNRALCPPADHRCAPRLDRSCGTKRSTRLSSLANSCRPCSLVNSA